MRRALIVCVSMILVGCGVDVLTTTAIQGELQAQNAAAAMRQFKSMTSAVGIEQVQQAVDMYTATHRAYPPSLDFLVPSPFPCMPTSPDGSHYDYNPSTGRVLSSTRPTDAMLAQDQVTIQQIEQAIQQCGRATGYYPGTLDDLSPTYLRQRPRTASGQEFYYNNQTGEVRHPQQTSMRRAASPGRQRGGGGTGSAAMAELAAGNAVRQQLNSMSQSGTSAAQAKSRQSINGITAQHNSQLERAVQEAGY